MNASTKRDGLSARQKTYRLAKKFKYPNHYWVFLVALSLMISSCHEQTNGQDKANRKDSAAIESLHKPKVNIEVSKHYDDKGNVIGVDSTYTSYYSNVGGDTTGLDSLMGSFNSYFNKNHFRTFGDEFDSIFFKDSLRAPDFFHDDFFLRSYELNDSYFRDMMNRMDSIKKSFYKDRSHFDETRDL